MTLLPFLAGHVRIKLLNYWRLSWDTGFPLCVVEGCVQETVLLFSSHLLNKEHVTFVFKDMGVLACRGDQVGMKFCPYLIHRLESKAGLLAALHSVSCPAFLGSLGFFGNALRGPAICSLLAPRNVAG